MLVSLIVTLTLVEPVVNSNMENDKLIPFRTYITASARFFRHNRGVFLVMLSGMVTGASINFIDEFWQTYLDRLGIPVIYFGMFSAAIFVLRLPGNMFAYLLKDRFGYSSLLSVVMAGLAAGFLYLSVIKDYSGLAVLFLICLLAGMIEPLAAGYLHHRIDSSMRVFKSGHFWRIRIPCNRLRRVHDLFLARIP
jgi:hypothetical protein